MVPLTVLLLIAIAATLVTRHIRRSPGARLHATTVAFLDEMRAGAFERAFAYLQPEIRSPGALRQLRDEAARLRDAPYMLLSVDDDEGVCRALWQAGLHDGPRGTAQADRTLELRWAPRPDGTWALINWTWRHQ